ncbi:putative baseplate assembly protein [Amycolatopsis sp. cg5]|uniref:putative baseplate assembly protein n=1 Tax=Amycolatopsis sp. cg5 TaxID=3238802 RepID=UPI003524CFAA
MTLCRTDRRRAKIRAERQNGIDGVEVDDAGLVLTVTFLGKAPHELATENIRIDGGRRITGIKAIDVELEIQEDPALDDRAHITVDKTGDHSTYRLSIVKPDSYGFPGTVPYKGFDPRYAHADFSFRQACPTDQDCRAEDESEPSGHPAPALDYTARDYESIRRVLLDRLTLTTPDWRERHVPDLGVTVAELLAYTGDQLSYYQDAVATEAYLDTARRRISVRRHARLVDYPMHDGSNARTFVSLEVDDVLTLSKDDFRFVAVDLSDLDPLQWPELGTVISDEDLERLPAGVVFEVFEPLPAGDLTLRPAHNLIRFWTWGDEECSLPVGATSATLVDDELDLDPGDVLIIEEVKGPGTGAAADADPAKRQAVRLLSVTPGVDKLYDQKFLEVTWAREDALGFSVCLSARGGQDCCVIEDISVARGNVVLADHGRSLTACGGAPEEIVVPPAPVDPPSCEPPESGCVQDSVTGPAADLIATLIAAAERREPLQPEDVRTLDDLLEPGATGRAGIVIALDTQQDREFVLPDTTEDQHAALRTLLAQVTYPPARRRFRPKLRYSPVTQQVAYPAPATVAASQAGLLAAIPGRVRARLAELWRQVHGGHKLTRDQIAELTVLFGEKTLSRLRLEHRPLQALRELQAQFDELLAAKIRRLGTLRARALDGGVLESGIGWELTQSWGEPYAGGLDPAHPALAGSAKSALRTDPRDALPAVTLGDPLWTPRRDLLDSGPRDRHFVGETEEGSGQIVLRFGDGEHGMAPPPGRTLQARYRVGNGTAGNVGAEAINHLVLCCGAMTGGVTKVRNPLSAAGGTEPESLDEVRQLAPLGLRRELLRAITPADYATLAAKVPGVQRAAAEARWTGAGTQIHVAIDPLGQGTPDAALLGTVSLALSRVRRIGHEVAVGPAILVPLDIELTVCLAPGYQREHVLAALKTVLGNGKRGLFHPDKVTFGDPVRTSKIVAVAAAVPGVATVRVTRLRRQFGQDMGELEAGLLRLGPLEIAQLDNAVDSPENGKLSFVVGGGR